MTDEKRDLFANHLIDFRELPALRDRVLYVLDSLPGNVLDDLLNDPRFTMSLDNYVPGKGSTVFMASPGTRGDGSRSIVLKPLLAESSTDFAHYVIAHEFAHAFLRNGPWGDITNVEDAADALAASWGFDRPAMTPWTKL